MAKRTIKGLGCDSVHTESVTTDWEEFFKLDGDWNEDARVYEAQRCEECGAVVVLDRGQGGEEHRNLCGSDDETECTGYVSTSEGPMMNYRYPLGKYDVERAGGAEAIAAAIVDLPLCVVENGDGFALALTGGGMDLSWEICEAFMLAGMLPPLRFAGNLPLMGGKKLDAKTRWILAGAARSAQLVVRWAQNDARRIRDIRKQLAGRA